MYVLAHMLGKGARNASSGNLASASFRKINDVNEMGVEGGGERGGI